MAMHRHVKRQLNSYRYASKGVSYALRTQVNIWMQLAATLAVMLLAWWLDFTLEQYLIVLLTIGFVITTELLNTAIEELTDLVSPQMQPKAGVVKDVAAGAVLVSATVAVVIGVVLFVPAIL